jgi:3,4-dihydroxy 2-butanone 4-phosphate synthase/GTP cyclohydrolase II
MSHPHPAWLSSIDELIEDARNGRMFILADDEDRENEGDLVIPAQMADAAAINFMAKHGRGLICLAMTGEQVDKLGLPMMASQNNSPHRTAFTVSIEAREGVTTGISAADRARTVAVAINPAATPRDVVTPGHVFPLVAQEGGVLVRTGHTEAGVDIARLAGLNPSAVICEIMNDDGSMARMPDLVKFAQTHNIKIGIIADLIAYRRRTEKLVEAVAETEVDSIHGGKFAMKVYRTKIGGIEHIALVKGDISGDEPVLVRVHRYNILRDLLGDSRSDAIPPLAKIMRIMGEKGRGVIVAIRDASSGLVTDSIQTYEHERTTGWTGSLRYYGIGAQILRDLGVTRMTLLTNSERSIAGLEGYDLTVVGRERVPEDRP